MKILRGSHHQWEIGHHRTAVTIGVYDGVHLGHLAVLEALKRHGSGFPLAVVTFESHPLEVLAPEHAPALITSLDQRLELLAGAGVDVIGLLDFDEALQRTTAHAFVEEVLVGALHAGVVAVGSDFRFGYQRAGDIRLLQQLAASHGFEAIALDLETTAGEVVSSTAIRVAISDGQVRDAERMLGRPFAIRGTVITGDGRGRTIGFPTANLEFGRSQVVPGRGVYAAVARIGDAAHGGVVNVGVRPTFGGDREVVEIHVLDFDEDLYGREIEVAFVARIRDEQRFSSVEDLVTQIGRDVVAARALLATI